MGHTSPTLSLQAYAQDDMARRDDTERDAIRKLVDGDRELIAGTA